MYSIENRPALLDLMLEAEAKDPQLTHQDIREEIDTFMFEVRRMVHIFIFIFSKINFIVLRQGHDTVSSAMSWFLYSMASNPHHQVNFKPFSITNYVHILTL